MFRSAGEVTMRSYWLRVAAGALAVFVIGMMFVAGVRATKAKARSALTGLEAELKTEHGGEIGRAALAGLKDSIAFTLNGERIGVLRRLTIDKPASDALPKISAVVALASPVDAAKLSGCDLVPESSDQLDRFRCAGRFEPNLETVGTVEFEREGLVRPLRVKPDLVEKLRKGEAFQLNADLTGPVDATVRKGEHELVRLKVDSTGAHLMVTGKDGKEIVRMKADSTGFSLVVDSAAR
jgi:hypothetical protein